MFGILQEKYVGNGTGRLMNIVDFLKKTWTDAKWIAQKFEPNVVIASSTYPFDIFVAKRIADITNAKIIFEVHDLWPLSPIQLGDMSPYHPFIILCQIAENYAYKKADVVVSMLPNVHKHMSQHGLNLGKLHIIPNGVPEITNTEGIEPIDGELARYLMEQKNAGSLVIGYAGAHGMPNSLDTLLDAAKLLNERLISFVLVGDGHEKKRLQHRVIDENIYNVKMFDPIPKAKVLSFLKNIDIAYIGLKNQKLFEYGVSPNKLMDYMMAGKPIIFSVKSGNDPVSDAGCGITIAPESPNDIVKAVLFLSKMTGLQRREMGRMGIEYVKSRHLYSVLAEKFMSIMKDGYV